MQANMYMLLDFALEVKKIASRTVKRGVATFALTNTTAAWESSEKRIVKVDLQTASNPFVGLLIDPVVLA